MRSVKEVKRKCTNRNGGYITYFKLYKEFNVQLNNVEFKPFQKFMIRLMITFQLIFKPLLCMIHTVTTRDSNFSHVDGSIVEMYSFLKKTTYYFLWIPIWYNVSTRASDKDIAELTE